ncbi:MAG: indole-3-glycerol phosphate synthase TrpC [Kiritimatiellae bacterium]|nr:indole-3-glycerol phosphate synthase TrpC [Kiritimatiellia bacterium]
MTILDELAALRREDASVLEKTAPLATLEAIIADLPPPPDFKRAFSGDGIHVIAELKKASPSKGLIREDFRPLTLALELERNGAAAISCLCEPHRFLGHEEYLRSVARQVAIPVLYKDFVTTRYQVARARVCGAAAVLLIAAALENGELATLAAAAREYGFSALVETHTHEEIATAIDAGADVIGVNCRDLKTFRTDPAITADLIKTIPSSCIRIAESGIRTHADIVQLRAAGADGFLIGETLMRQPAPGAMLRELTASY